MPLIQAVVLTVAGVLLLLNIVIDLVYTALDPRVRAQLYHINPYRFAARAKVDRIGALRAFLHLTKGGLFNLYWNIHCPACKGVTQHSNTLLTLKHADKCGVCSTVFDAGFDTSIDAAREIALNFCVGEGQAALEIQSRNENVLHMRRRLDAAKPNLIEIGVLRDLRAEGERGLR